MRIPSVAAVAALGSIACATAADDYPVAPGGGPTMPGTSGSGSDVIRGRVCRITADARDLTACAGLGAGDLAVMLGNQVTFTLPDGTFELPLTTTIGGFRVMGPGVVPTHFPFRSGPRIPVIDADLWSQMLAANGIVLTAGSGSIFGRVTRADAPLAGVFGISTPSPAFGPLFDGSTPTAWQLNGTGARGIVWFPGIAAGPTNLTFRDLATSGETTVDGVQVINGGITILDSVILP